MTRIDAYHHRAAKRGLLRGVRADASILSDIFRSVPSHRVAAPTVQGSFEAGYRKVNA